MIELLVVTEEDIRQGLRYHVNRCPIALAVRRLLGKNLVEVRHRGVLVDGRTHYPLPWRARVFVWTFDWLPHCWPFVRPFSFPWEHRGA
jgi:hypothetical protein